MYWGEIGEKEWVLQKMQQPLKMEKIKGKVRIKKILWINHFLWTEINFISIFQEFICTNKKKMALRFPLLES